MAWAVSFTKSTNTEITIFFTEITKKHFPIQLTLALLSALSFTLVSGTSFELCNRLQEEEEIRETDSDLLD